MARDASGHDAWHAFRVRTTAVRLARAGGADRLVVELAALLHDVADWKACDGDAEAGPRAARRWLARFDLPRATVGHVCDILRGLSFKGAGVREARLSREGEIVRDADRLDAIGAIGIARAFAYGGSRGRPMHVPGARPARHRTAAAYLRGGGSTLNHFHEKLLRLRGRMRTPAARRLAAGRHAFLRRFLARFLREWEGRL
jgi:uncharacterized protein